MVKILIVEDERIVAEDIKQRLKNMGYTSFVETSGEKALQKYEELSPDLILMDIVLGGRINGIEAADHIRSHFAIPIVFLTAHADEKTLEKAKLTEPYGFLVKPFKDRELHATIEMALYKCEMEKKVRDSHLQLVTTLKSMADAVIATDEKGVVTFMNPVAESLTGWTLEEAGGNPLEEVLILVSETGTPLPDYVSPVIREGSPRRLARHTLIAKNGKRIPIDDSASPILEGLRTTGAVIVFRDITEYNRTEMQLRTLFEASKLINSTMDMSEIFNFISDSYRELVGFDNFVVFLVSEDKKSLYVAYASEEIRSKVEGVVLEYGEGLIGYAVTNKETLLLGNAHKDKRAKKMPGVTEIFTSQIAVPLIIEGECVGAIHISKVRENAYSDEDVNALKPLSEVISSAVRNSQLYHRITESGRELEKRITERSRRIEILLNTRLNLQRESNWENGLKTIVDSMENLGFERVGIFLVDPMRKTLNSHIGKGIELLRGKLSILLNDTDYFGVKCVTEKRTIYVEEFTPQEGKQISESQSFVWVPIIVQNEAFAALAADNAQSGRVVTEEDVKDLEILAGMCAAFIDRTRILVEPVAEKQLKTAFKHWLDPAEGYIVLEKKAEKSLEIFCDLVTHAIPGFVVTRVYPGKLRRTYELARTPMMWLSRSGKENTIGPDDLHKLSYIVSDFTRKSEESVILLDGLEYLITQLGFSAVLKYVQELRDIIIMNNSRLIIPFHKDTLSPKEYSGLEREFTIL